MTTGVASEPKWMKWTGFVLSVLVIAFLIMDFTMKLMQLDIVKSTGLELGWAEDTALPLGVTLMICTVLYAIPQTAVFGAVLLTGYLGGSVATHVRIGSPLFSHVLFGVYLGLFVWGGLWLREPRLRTLFPLRR